MPPTVSPLSKETAPPDSARRPVLAALADGRVFLAAAAVVVAAGLVPVFRWGGNVDVAWYLYIARRLLGGARLYRDIIEINPPLIAVLSLPAALVARVLDVSGIAVSNLLTAVLAIASVALAARPLRQLLGAERLAECRAVLLAMLVALFPIAVADFGQREHLLLMLVLPYLCLTAARAAGHGVPVREAAVAGLLAGLGIALKPFYLPLWVLIEAYLVLVRGGGAPWKRPEAIAITAVLVCYTAAVVFLVPDYLPLAARFGPLYTDLLRRPAGTILWSAEGAVALFAIAALALPGGRGDFSGLRMVLGIAMAAFITAVLIQQKGWSYHFLPVRGGGLLVLGVVLIGRQARARRLATRVAAAVLLLGLAVSLGVALRQSARQAVAQARFELQIERDMVPLVRQYARGATIMALTVSPSPAFPLVNLAGVGWASRFPSLWMIPALYAREHWRSLSDSSRVLHPSVAERYLVDAVTEDLVTRRPALAIVYTPPGAPDLAGYFARADRRFAVAWAGYRPVGLVGGYTFLQRAGVERP